MTIGIVAGVVLVVLVGVYFKGRSAGVAVERTRNAGLAKEAEASRVKQAEKAEREEVAAAIERREDELRRPAVDRANERLRRRGIIPAFVAALLAASPARAECRDVGDDTVCKKAEFIALMDELDLTEEKLAVEKARSKRLDEELRAAQDRAKVVAPAPSFPIVEFVVSLLVVAALAFGGGVAVGSH